MRRRVRWLILLQAWLSREAAGRQLLVGRGRHDEARRVRKPMTDQRAYEHVRFSANGLSVLAVEDRRAVKAGFAVAVQAGSFYDPPDFPGLAHFCEHLLFLGTEKYPDEASFDEFMALHDGSNNAYTEQEHTVFYNEVGHAGFEEGLDRFAQFFVAPLFKQDMVGRELNAVNSEHEKNMPDQGRRLWEILRGTARPGSVVGRFYTGTAESLHHGDASAVAALRRYHDANYCATRMSLVLVANLSTAEQLRTAHKYFDDVPRGNCAPKQNFSSGRNPQKVTPAAFDADHLGQYIRMGTKSTPALWIMFPLSATAGRYREGPMAFLSYMIGYAGAGSLRSQLKRKGLINNLELQADETSAATLFFLMYDLTPEGAKEDGVQEIAGTTFAYLRLLHSEQQAEVPLVYDSLRRMSQVSFDYSEAPDSVMDAVSDLAAAAARYPAEDVVAGSFGLMQRTDPALVRSLLAELARGPRAANLALATPGWNASAATAYEKYYGIRFEQRRLPEAWLRRWDSRATAGLRPPPPLRYVPKTLKVLDDSAGPHPVLLKATEADGEQSGVEVWWQGAGAFKLPKAQIRLKLTLPRTCAVDAEHEIAKRLHVELARQLLEESTEDMQNCGLNFKIDSVGTGYVFQMDGYNERLGDLMAEMLHVFLDPEFDLDELNRTRRQVRDNLADTTRQAPFELALSAVAALTTDDLFGREELLAALDRSEGEGEAAFRSHLRKLRFGGFRAQLLLVGNVDRKAARALADRASEALRRPIVQGKASLRRPRLLSSGEAQRPQRLLVGQPVELRMLNPVPGDANHAIVNTYQFGVPDVSERVRLMLVGKMISNPVYDTLRTQEQLGYVVSGFMTEQAGVVELQVLVQGAKKDPDQVDVSIERVIDKFGSDLRNMSRLEFSKWKNSTRSALQRKDQNMAQEADRHWGHIVNDGHCFDRNVLAQQYLETLTSASDVVDIFADLRRSNRKVSVKFFGVGEKAHSLLAARPAASSVRLHDTGKDAKRRLSVEGHGKYTPVEEVCRISKLAARDM